MQANRRKGSMSDKDPTSSSSAPNARAPTPSRPALDRKSAANNNKSTSNARSSSAPKQRGKNSTAATSGSSATSSALPTPYDLALAKMAAASAGKSADALERMLQQLLQTAQYRDAAYLIAANTALSTRFKTSDVVRLVLDAKQFSATAELIRELSLQTNQLLVTLFVKELVRSAQFHAAVRYATEFVQNFGKTEFGPRELERPSWTPQALIQAMIRATQFKTALKFAKQFDLLALFAPTSLVASMLDARQFDDAVASVMEFRLVRDFPIDTLVVTMLRNRQWSLAVKCMAKLTDKLQFARFADALVRDAAKAGDFISALRYLREFKLDTAAHRAVQEALVDSMVTFSEMYKAIKYAIKFALAPTADVGANADITGKADVSMSTSRFATAALIRHAIAIGQTHVATFYIKKLRLQDAFAAELATIEDTKRARLQEFRDFVGFRESQMHSATAQQQLAALLGSAAHDEVDDWVELAPVTREIVLSETVEVVPRRLKKPVETESMTSFASGSNAATATAMSAIISSNDGHVPASRDVERQSRFNFARTSSTDAVERTSRPAPPPGLAMFAPSPGVGSNSAIGSNSSSGRTDEIVGSSFNFAAFASAVQSSTSSDSTSTQQPPQQLQPRSQGPPGMQQPQTHSHQSQGPPGMQQPLHQSMQMASSQHANSMFAHHNANAPSNHFGRGPVAPPPPPPTFAPSFPPSNSSSGFMQPPQAPPPSYMMALPPQQNATGGGNNSGFPGMDIASLAMQFHSSGGARGPLGAPVFGSSNNGNGNSGSGAGGMGYSPQMPMPMPMQMPMQMSMQMPPPQQLASSGAPPALNHLFPGFAPPPPPPQFAAPPPPRSAFKPSIGYTSVTTTRQKR